MKHRRKPRENPDIVFYDEAEEESYKRYKHRCYRNLILESLLAFALGLLFMFLLKHGF